jgi:hypothetical protein
MVPKRIYPAKLRELVDKRQHAGGSSDFLQPTAA